MLQTEEERINMLQAEKQRFVYIDNLRLLMIFFVVIMHAAVTYSGMGSWYYIEETQLGLISTIVFGLYQSFTQAYFMGFLFLISGYFVPASYDKKGFKKFIKDRLIRLGIPTLIFMIVINPFTVYFLLKTPWHEVRPSFWSYYSNYIIKLELVGGSGPLWFAFALLIFNIIYALFRKLIKNKGTRLEKDIPRFSKILLLILIIAVVAFLIRIVQPIGTSILNMQLSFFSQYIILFIVGIWSYRNNWFSKLDTILGSRWLKAALIPGVIMWAVVMITGGALDGNFLFYGGLRWQSAAYALWESFIAVAMSIGLIVLFRERFNKQNHFIKILSDNSFSVYMFHTPVLVAISLLMKEMAFPALIKFLFLCIFGTATCFLMTNYIFKKIPLLNKVL